MWSPESTRMMSGSPRSRSHGRPAPMCSFKEWGRYCVRIMTSTIPELTQLESVKSMMRYFPAKGTAGLARFWERRLKRSPWPPARMIASTLLIAQPILSAWLEVQRGAALLVADFRNALRSCCHRSFLCLCLLLRNGAFEDKQRGGRDQSANDNG